MWPSEWSGDRVVAAAIIGICTLVAALIKAYVELSGSRSRKRRTASTLQKVRRVSGGIIAGGGVVFAALLTGGFLEAPDASTLLHVAGGGNGTATSSIDTSAESSDDAAGGAAYAAPVASTAASGASEASAASASASSDGPIAEWLQTEATTIYYRYTRYLPDACPGRPTAHGSWAEGLEAPVAVRCGDRGWLAFDVEPLVEQGRVVPNITYCVNFRDSSGVWGRHAAEDAPGLSGIAVSAARVPLGRAIGFRYVRSVPYDVVVLTRELPRAAC